MTTTITRRSALRLLGAAPAAAAMVWTPAEAQQAHAHVAQAARQVEPYRRKFFTAHEYATVGILVDLIIPKDERSGSATEAGVPQFMDFMMVDQPRRQIAMRGGLALVDRLTVDRVGKAFAGASDAQRRDVLDQIAYTSNPDRRLSQAIAFFSSFRDLTASGFWTTKMGIADLQYQGNIYVNEWNGCPSRALDTLGVKYS